MSPCEPPGGNAVHNALRPVLQAHQEVIGKAEPDHVPTDGFGGVDEQYAQRNRESLAPVDDTHEVRVLDIVVSQGIARITLAFDEDLAQHLGPVGLPGRSGGHRRGDFVKVFVIAREWHFRPVERCQ